MTTPTSSVRQVGINLDDAFPIQNAKGQAARSYFQIVADDVLAVLYQIIPGALDHEKRAIFCLPSLWPTPCVDGISDPERINVYLYLEGVAENLDYNQFTFQLSHELGHVVMGTSRSNGIIEMLAAGLSYEVLDRMVDHWQTNHAHHQSWKDWAPNFRKARLRVQNERMSRIPEEIQRAVEKEQWAEVTTYLRANRLGLLSGDLNSQRSRDLQSLAAVILRANSFQWRDIVGISYWTLPPPTESPEPNMNAQMDITRFTKSFTQSMKQIGVLDTDERKEGRLGWQFSHRPFWYNRLWKRER